MALLAELSSITASPAPAQEKLSSVSVSGRAPPCNSTPRSPDVRRRVMTGFIEANLQDSPVCDPPPPVYQQSESFTTPRDTSPPPFKVDSDSSLQGFFTTCQEEEVSETASTVEGEGKVEQEEEGEGAEASDQSEESQEEMVKECTEGEENMEAEEGGSNYEEAVGSEVEEDEDEEEDIDDRKEIAGNVEEGGDNVLMKIRELAADPVAAHQTELRVSPGSQSPSVFDDTNRAHSTLDDVLQGYLEEGTTKSPVASKSVTKL
ncbi:Dynein heavy chain-like protein [Dissostichus eleginoides]|uniref:Dynein heavy chain-like protein n=1 Tax=Dissostichus eleginoides TaxID=100907 RepID=A0AAD9BFR2_DISEL|nr:Dynein heavy chain-like protein [Dissostichus eleginoides]